MCVLFRVLFVILTYASWSKSTWILHVDSLEVHVDSLEVIQYQIDKLAFAICVHRDPSMNTLKQTQHLGMLI
jgi:hypothetical protein